MLWEHGSVMVGACPAMPVPALQRLTPSSHGLRLPSFPRHRDDQRQEALLVP